MPWPGLSGRAHRILRWVALALNGALFLVGLYFELWPRYRTDVWSAGALCAIALGNSAALTSLLLLLPPALSAAAILDDRSGR